MTDIFLPKKHVPKQNWAGLDFWALALWARMKVVHPLTAEDLVLSWAQQCYAVFEVPLRDGEVPGFERLIGVRKAKLLLSGRQLMQIQLWKPAPSSQVPDWHVMDTGCGDVIA